jgi:hypothetical protein
MTTWNFDDIEFTGYYAAPAELPVKIFADSAEATSKEHNSTIAWLWPVSPAHSVHTGRLAPQNSTKEFPPTHIGHGLRVSVRQMFLSRSRLQSAGHIIELNYGLC